MRGVWINGVDWTDGQSTEREKRPFSRFPFPAILRSELLQYVLRKIPSLEPPYKLEGVLAGMCQPAGDRD